MEIEKVNDGAYIKLDITNKHFNRNRKRCECIDDKCSCMALTGPKHKCLEMFIYQLRACHLKVSTEKFSLFQNKNVPGVDVKFSKIDMNKSAILVLFGCKTIFIKNPALLMRVK